MTALALVRLKPVRRPWPAAGLPKVVYLKGRRYLKSNGIGRPGVVAHYREDVPRMSAHAYVLSDGTYLIDHLDEANPRYALLAHLLKDVL